MADYNRKLQATRRISAVLCAKEDETAEAVERLQEEYANLKQMYAQLQERAFEAQGKCSGDRGRSCLPF